MPWFRTDAGHRSPDRPIGGDDAAARIEANGRTLILEIEDLALRYLRLKSGSLMAEYGIRADRDKPAAL